MKNPPNDRTVCKKKKGKKTGRGGCTAISLYGEEKKGEKKSHLTLRSTMSRPLKLSGRKKEKGEETGQCVPLPSFCAGKRKREKKTKPRRAPVIKRGKEPP